jgi:hypothetical protein
VADGEFDGIPVGELPIDEVVWSQERANHIRTRAERKGPAEINIEPLWASEAALDPNRLVRRGRRRRVGGGAGLLAVGAAGAAGVDLNRRASAGRHLAGRQRDRRGRRLRAAYWEGRGDDREA